MECHALWIKAASVVTNGQCHRLAPSDQRHIDAMRVRVPFDVGQRLLSDAEQDSIGHVWQALGIASRRKMHGRRTVFSKFMRQVIERCGEAKVVEDCGPQVVRDAPHLAQHVVQLLSRVFKTPPCLLLLLGIA